MFVRRNDMVMQNNMTYVGIMESRVSPFIQQTMRQKQITGLSVALVDDSQILFAKGYGFADKQAHRLATPHTVYKIGSITKIFTGTAAMQLYERGLLDIDKPVVEYLPEFSIKNRTGDISQITPRTLMTHHSGIPSDWYLNYWSDEPHAFRNVPDYLQESHLAFSPNTVFSYSNLAMSLLGIIIERVSNQTYQQYIEQNILAPLHMTDSALVSDKVSSSLLSKAYAQGKEVDDPILRDAPAGAIFSNVQDMARFASMILAGGNYLGANILENKTLDEMLLSQNESIQLDFGFRIGLNWMLSRPSLSFAGRVCWHDGGSPHFYSILIALPDLKLGAIVLSNSDGGMINVGLIADEILKHAAAVKTGQNVPVLKNSLVASQIKKNKEEKFVTGRFASANGMVKFIQHNHALRAIMQGQQFSLKSIDGEWYSLQLLLFGWMPLRIASIASLYLTVRTIDGRRILGADQYGLQVPFGIEYMPISIPVGWADALGKYHLKTDDKLPPFNSLSLTIEGDVLFLRTTARKVGKMAMVLQPVSDTEAIVLGFGRAGGVTVELLNHNDEKILRMLGLEFIKN
jgi:CubicO group peptidase (beta-lactamase class C family)